MPDACFPPSLCIDAFPIFLFPVWENGVFSFLLQEPLLRPPSLCGAALAAGDGGDGDDEGSHQVRFLFAH